MKKTIILLIVLLVLTAGCNEQKQLSPVSVQLIWLHQAEFAGIYVAKEKGFYKENGIEITDLRPFDYVNYPIDAVENKSADFGIADMGELILAKAAGKARHVKAIAAIYQINPICLYSPKESGIIKPADLLGKTVGIEQAPDGTELNVGILYKAMMSKLHLNRSLVHEVTIGYDATELLDGRTDVSSGYVTNEPQQVIASGREVNVILMGEYGVNIPTDLIIVHEDTIKERPQVVESFLAATLEGWQYAIENEDYAVNATLKYAVNNTRAHEEYVLEHSIPLINTGDSPIGWMEKSDWEAAQNILQDTGEINNPINTTEAYTTKFLENIYGV